MKRNLLFFMSSILLLAVICLYVLPLQVALGEESAAPNGEYPADPFERGDEHMREVALDKLERHSEEGLKFSSRAVFLADADSDAELYGMNADERYQIASMVKIMTLLLTFEAIERGELCYEQKLTVSENAFSMGGSQMFLDKNTDYLVSDLILGAVMVSANDACVALAEAIAGSEEGFVVMMNERARELGMTNTCFINCTGLNIGEGQYSSARDCAIMYRALIRHTEYFKYCKHWLLDYTHPSGRITTFTNTNKLIRFYKDNEGGKTGYTSDSLFCITTSSRRGGMHVIAVVIGAKDSKTRFGEATRLTNYAFANYRNEIALDAASTTVEVSVKGGKVGIVNSAPERSVGVLTKRGEDNSFSVEYVYDAVSAPIAIGDKVGTALVYNKGELIAEVSLLSTEDVAKIGYLDIFGRLLQ